MQSTSKQKIIETAERLGINPEHVPRHIAIIMDGNGRWAQKRRLPRIQGHYRGGKTVEKIAQHCVDVGIKVLTLYSFSIENWKRPREEIDSLMHLYSRYLVEIRPTLMRNDVKLVHLGRMQQLPSEVTKCLKETMQLTEQNKGMILALALNYGGRSEIIDAVRNIAQKCKNGELNTEQIDENCLAQHLYTAELSDPDLLIRTAGEMRISNFLLWQISYSEFYVTDVFWPDFTQEDLENAILEFSRRNRRFGAVNNRGKQ